MKRAVIFVNGNKSDLSLAKKFIEKNDYLIAADGGAKHILKLGLAPHVIIGDFDSLPKKLLKKFSKTELIEYPAKKNKTDFELAVDLCLERKYQEIIILGIFGDRIDHMLSNIFLLAKILKENKQMKIKIIEGKKIIYIMDKIIEINGKIGDEISIVPLSDKLKGIKTIGLEYKLDNETIAYGSTRGISNIMSKPTIKITVSKGVAMVEHNQQ
jgi:thiamine pyrophosphokinase